jgi:LacI family transcriptional regulator of maltose regulon
MASRATLNSGWRWRRSDVPEAALDDLPLTWVTTPAREMGKTLAESMLRRLEEGRARRETRLCPRGW